MKFITEEDLRDLYKKAPFTSYEPDPAVRLTPGARQFLSDRGIYMFDDEIPGKKAPNFGKPEEAVKTAEAEKAPAGSDWKGKKLLQKMKSMDATFLLTEEELLRKDVCLAQSVIELRKQFACIQKAVGSGSVVEDLCCKECTGITKENFSESLEDCFEINEFHIQLEKGKEIALLHRLRCALQEIEPTVFELQEGSNAKLPPEEIVGKVNQISNSLSQLICQAFGGKVCQRKI